MVILGPIKRAGGNDFGDNGLPPEAGGFFQCLLGLLR
jgi:hypothetical protein